MEHQPPVALRQASRGSLADGANGPNGDVQREIQDEEPLLAGNPQGSHHHAEGCNPPRDHAHTDSVRASSPVARPTHPFEGSPVEREEDTSLLCDKGKQLLNVLSDGRNKVLHPVRERIMDIFFDLQTMFMSLRTKLSRAEGTIDELRSQLAECRHEEVIPHNPPPVPRQSFANALRNPRDSACNARVPEPSLYPPLQPVQHHPDKEVRPLATDPNHVLHIRPLLPSAHPGPETITLLKSTFGNDPSGIGVKQVKLIPNRTGLTVVSADRASIENLEKAIEGNTQLRTAIKVIRPPRRLPQFKISGVDPSIVPGILRTNINARNGLNIRDEEFKHRTYFKDRTGNNVHIVEVSPSVYHILKAKDRLLIGWTSCPIKENFYVAACSRCCTYGHVALRCNSESVCCLYCAGDHLAEDCTLADKENVVCRECRAAGRRFNHTFNAQCCFTIEWRVARMRQKTIYDTTPTSTSPSTVSA